ncbi:MAG: PAS domain-containing protein [Chloroflexi bacterium]|nr:PAS domain-containing protein [Chloroflexota bacterium]MYD17923.1 PAS domain-containing protein [Chloroflexota bacterium]MYJ01743.1 PAS domain-containing protein [Chloroflexota bacterium]
MRTVGLGVIALLLGVGLFAADVSVGGGALALAVGAALCAFSFYLARRGLVELREQSAGQLLTIEELGETLTERTAERDQLTRALASTGDMVIAVDRDARIQYLNPAAELTLRSGDREPLGAPLLEAVEDPDLYGAVRLAIEEGTPAVLVVLRAERRFRTVVAPLADVAGAGPWSVVLAMHDLSDLYEAEVARRDFFINASHELRTPLASISAAAETLEVARTPEDSHRFREIIQNEAARMGQLVEEMLALARLESGLTEPEMEVVGMESLLAGAVESIRPQAEREGLSLSYAGLKSGAETMLMADPELVERALLNLLHNAVKFTDAGGAVEVLTEPGDEADPAPMVWIRVRDTGIGIEPAEQSRIFQRFYRIDRARQSGGGTGLGLAVVRHIAEVHGGAVSLQSAPGEGSTFGFSVPLAQQS